MRSLLKPRKAQFFILSVFTIVSILYFLSRWLEPSTLTDTSSIALMGESFVFDNIKERTFDVVNGSKTREELFYNLEEYKKITEYYALTKGYSLYFNYSHTPFYEEDPDFPVYIVLVRQTITSPRITLQSNYSIPWPA